MPMRHDNQSVTAIVRHTLTSPLPILDPKSEAGLGAVKVWTDISGHIVANPSLGLYNVHTIM